MLKKEQLERIGELSRKQRTVGLTTAEQAEQEALRRAYIELFRLSFRQQLESQGLQPKDAHSESCPCGHKHLH